MTRTRTFILGSVSSLILLVAGLVLVIAFFDWNRIKPTLNAKVSEALHRSFAINGDLSVVWQRDPDEGGWRAWLPWPHVVAEDLTLGNPDWSKTAQMVSLRRVELRIAPLALLAQRLSIPRIDLTEPDAALQRLADGRANWTFKFDSKDSDAEPSSWTVEIGAIGFDKGHVTLDDQRLNTQLDLQVALLGKPIAFSEIVGEREAKTISEQGAVPQAYAFGLKVKGQYHGEKLVGTGKMGGLLALQDARKPFPLQAQAQVGDTRVELRGTLTDPLNLGALDLRLTLAGSSLGNLYPLTGITLPDSPAYATDGRLSAKLRDPAGASYRYQDFNGKIGDSDIHGNLTYLASQPRPKLSGVLVSDQLLFRDLAPLIGADSNAKQQARGGESKQPTGKVLPVEEFRTERWRDMDADVEFTGKRIVHSTDLPFTDLYTHLLLDDGLLSLEPLRFGVAGGRLDAKVRLNGRSAPLEGQARLTARHVKLKQLLPSFEPLKTSLGELNGDADIAGRGHSVAALLGSANGDLKMLINDGAISRSLMEIAGLNVGNYVVGKIFGDKEVKINCAAVDLGIKTGLATSRLFVFDTENAVIYVDGSANMASEQLDLTITPESKGLRLLSLRSPLYVQGAFSNPNAGVKAVPLVLRGAAMVALGVIAGPAAGLLALVAPSGGDEPNLCAPLLQQMRLGKAPVTVKPSR